MHNEIRQRALALYRPPFVAGDTNYILDADGHIVADNLDVSEEAPRVRGWGCISYLPEPEALQDEVKALLREAGCLEPGLSPEIAAEKLTALWRTLRHPLVADVCGGGVVETDAGEKAPVSIRFGMGRDAYGWALRFSDSSPSALELRVMHDVSTMCRVKRRGGVGRKRIGGRLLSLRERGKV